MNPSNPINASIAKTFLTHPLTKVSILLAMMGAIYFNTILSIIKSWITLENAHGFLIFAISMYLICRNRNILRQLPLESSMPKGLTITAIGCLLFVIGSFGSILLLLKISLIISIIGLVWLLLGSAHGKILLLPLGYLLLMFPIFDEILGNLSIYFQMTGAFIASTLLQITGMPIYRYAQFIEMPHATLEVAKLCNGIAHITAIVSLAIPLSYVTLHTNKSKGLFILFAVLIAIFANGLRIALIGIWTLYFKESSIHGPFNTLYSSSVFLVEVIALIIISTIIGKKNIRRLVAQDASGVVGRKNLSAPRINSRGIVFGTILFSVAGIYAYLFAPLPVGLKKELREVPLVIGNWHGENVDRLVEDLERATPDSELKRVYHDGAGNAIHLYIGYFASQRQNNEVVSYRYDWLHNNSQVIRFSLNPHGNLEINKTRYYKNKKNQFAYFWYNIDGKIMAGRYRTKLAILKNAFLLRRTNGALIVISFEESYRDRDGRHPAIQIQFLKDIFPILNHYFDGNIS